jgi:CRP/FNR family nitrogen fixation transcriptional regulator
MFFSSSCLALFGPANSSATACQIDSMSPAKCSALRRETLIACAPKLSAIALSSLTVVGALRRWRRMIKLFRVNFFAHAMKNLARAQEHSLSLGRRNAVEKVAAFLIELFEKAPDAKVITLAMTRQDIADYLGLTMETVSRTLSQLERDAFIELTTARQIRMKDRAALGGLNS